MAMPGRKFEAVTNSTYRYSINGQEKEKELNENITTALYWEYDSRIGRRWNTDPMPTLGVSSYAVFLNNPIGNMDVLGDTIDIKYNQVTDDKGNTTAINVSITITGKILNDSDHDKEIDVDEINKRVASEISRLFNNKTVDPSDNGNSLIKWNVSIQSNFTTATNMDQVLPSDHLIVIVDDVDYEEGIFNQSIIGVANRNAKIAYVEAEGSSSFGCNKNWRPDYQQMSRVAVHEFLHNMGLKDLYNAPKSEQIEGNYMMRYDPENYYPTLTNAQLYTAISSIHNQGDNFSYSKDVKHRGWIDTSNNDPEKKSTRGKDGKIPMVIAD